MRGLVLDGVLVTSWLIVVGLVVLHERGALWGGVGNPAASLRATVDAQEQWFGFYYQGQKIGYSHTMMMPEEQDGVPGVSVIDKGRLSFNLLGTPQQLEVSSYAFIDADWRLRTFTAAVRSSTSRLQWSGQRRGDRLLVTVTTPTNALTKQIKDPLGSAMVNGLSSWAAFHRLRVGQSGKAWVLNPLALSPEPVYFIVRRSEVVDGKDALVVETDVSGLTTTSWVTPMGEVLKETSPLGWELRRESSEQALQPVPALSPALDLLSATAVPVDRPLDNPQAVSRLVLLLEGIEGSELAVRRPWQTLLPADRLHDYGLSVPEGPWCLVQLDRPTDAPHHEVPLPSALTRYRQPSLFVQSADPRIMTKAAQIIGARTDPWDRVTAIHQWVYQTLTKQLTIGLPSAVDILATPVGDCHEHTILFTALTRSVNIPTRMVAGLVYQRGRFYYHAWPEVWLGEWLPTDPTLGQPLADVTHLGLVEAEDESLMALAQFVGKLRVHVLAVEGSPSDGRRPVP